MTTKQNAAPISKVGPGRKPGTAKTGGRTKGTPNRMTAAVKDMIVQALDEAGGVEYLVKQAHVNPKAFLSLVGRVLPLQVTGEGGGPVETSITVTFK